MRPGVCDTLERATAQGCLILSSAGIEGSGACELEDGRGVVVVHRGVAC